MQGWEYIKGKQICTFYKKNKENKENLIIFFMVLDNIRQEHILFSHR